MRLAYLLFLQISLFEILDRTQRLCELILIIFDKFLLLLIFNFNKYPIAFAKSSTYYFHDKPIPKFQQHFFLLFASINFLINAYKMTIF